MGYIFRLYRKNGNYHNLTMGYIRVEGYLSRGKGIYYVGVYIGEYWVIYKKNGKENGNYHSGLYRGLEVSLRG